MSGMLVLPSAPALPRPAVIAATTPLREVLIGRHTADAGCVFVHNELGEIDSIVDLTHVRRLLSAENSIERERWERVCVGTIAEKIFAIPRVSTPDATDQTRNTSQRFAERQGPESPSAAVVLDGVASETLVISSRLEDAADDSSNDTNLEHGTRTAGTPACDQASDRLRMSLLGAGTAGLAREPSAAAVLPGLTTVSDHSGCVALVTETDTYVSWSRIAAAMQSNHVDPVTGLPTRLSFNRRIREEVDRAARGGGSLTLLLIDLDHFKQVNDRFGHRAGDETLRMVANALRAGVRSYDCVARYGGDEFVIICFNCPPDEVHLPIIRLQRAVDAQQPPSDVPGTRVSLSIGAAVLRHVDAQCPTDLIVEQADACLYRAKNNGRSTAFTIELDGMACPSSPVRQIRWQEAGFPPLAVRS